MKFCKIRLTKCAKSKLRVLLDDFKIFLIIVSIFSGILLSIFIIPAIIGLVAQAIIVAVQGDLIGFIINPEVLGFAIIAGTMLLVAVGVVIWNIWLGMVKPLVTFIVKTTRVLSSSEKFECRIFERCE